MTDLSSTYSGLRPILRLCILHIPFPGISWCVHPYGVHLAANILQLGAWPDRDPRRRALWRQPEPVAAVWGGFVPQGGVDGSTHCPSGKRGGNFNSLVPGRPHLWEVNIGSGSGLQQAITWANVDLDLYCHIASLGHNELKVWSSNSFHGLISWANLIKLLSGKCHRTPLKTSQYWFM